MNFIRSALDWFGWERLSDTKKRHQQIMSKLSNLAAALTGIDSKLTEAQMEIVAEIQKLRDSLGNVELPPEAEAALASIQAKANALADVIPNAEA
jgi:vacuolar-type H+-ATPase subunit E/Vma4